MQGILKWPLIVAAIVVVLRVIVERAGAPAAVSNLLSVAPLMTVLGPLYFALQIGLAASLLDVHPTRLHLRGMRSRHGSAHVLGGSHVWLDGISFCRR